MSQSEQKSLERTLERDSQKIESDIEASMEFVQKSIFLELDEEDIMRSLKFDPVARNASDVALLQSDKQFVDPGQRDILLEVVLLQPILVLGVKNQIIIRAPI